MSNTILIKRSGTANAIPSSANLSLGELAINYTDGNLFYKDAGGTVKVIASNQTFTLSGNISAGNVTTGGVVTATGNITGGNINTANIVSAGGNVIAGNINTTGIANVGTLTVTGNTNLGNVGNVTITGGSSGYLLTTDGAGNLSWSATASTNTIFNGDSNVSIPVANGNIYINANAGSDQQWVFDTTGFLTLSNTGVITSPVGTGIDIFTGNVSYYSEIYLADSGNVTISTQGETYNWAFGTDGNLTAPSGSTANLGNLVVANNFSTNGTGGDITLTGGNILGANVVFANSFTSNGGLVDFNTNNANVQLGSNANVHLYGGSNGQVLQTDGAGNLTWSSISTTSIQNGNSNVTIPVSDGNVYINANAGSDQQWVFSTDGNLTIPGWVQGTANGFASLVGLDNGGGAVAQLMDWDVANGAPKTLLQVSDNVTVTTNVIGSAHDWNLDSTGNTTFPAIGTANLGNLVTANYASFNNDVTVGGNITTTGSQGNIEGANVISANSFVGTGGTIDFVSEGNISLGNVGNIHIDGGSNGYLLTTDGAGNLSWSATASTTEIFNGFSNVSIPVANGNVYINANAASDQQWVFGTDGTLTFPLVNSQTSIQQQRYGMGNLVGYLDGGWVLGEYNGTAYGTEGIRISPGIEGNVEVILPSDANAATNALQLNNYVGNVNINANQHFWNFDNAGNTQFPAIGTANLGNLVTANYASFNNDLGVGGNIVTGTGSGGNITGVNYLVSNVVNTGSISATGNAIIGNISSAGNITGANIVAITAVDTGNINHATSISITASTGNINLSPLSGNVVMANTYINGVAYPQQDQDAASKIYVDNLVTTGFAFHTPVQAATVTDLDTATGGTVSYSEPNGAGNGIGALLTTTGSFYLIDTSNVQTVGTRILVKNEANAAWNGVYTYSNTTAIVRSTDADQYGPDSTEALSLNDYFFVQAGNVNAGSAYVVSAPAGTITFGTSNITFAQFSSSQTYSANTAAGLELINQTFNAKVDNNTTAFDGGGNIIVKASANLTTPNIGDATGTSLSLSGNVVAGNVDAGSGVIVTTGNITGGNVLFGSGQVSGTGNISSGNITVGTGSGGSITGANLISANIFSATGNITGGNANITGTTPSNDTTTGALIVAGGVGVVGNIYAGGMYVGTDSVLTINSTVDGGTY